VEADAQLVEAVEEVDVEQVVGVVVAEVVAVVGRLVAVAVDLQEEEEDEDLLAVLQDEVEAGGGFERACGRATCSPAGKTCQLLLNC